jgi:hypothetical protein
MTTIDADEIEGVTFNGDEIKEITMDGDVVWKGTYLEESFEDGNDDGWNATSSGIYVTSNTASDGSYSYRFDRDSDWSTTTNFDTGQYIDEFAFSMYLTDADYRPIVRLYNDSNTDLGNSWSYIQVQQVNSKTVLTNQGHTTEDIMSYDMAQNTWYRVRLENIDYNNEIYDLVLYDNNGNEIERIDNAEFYNSSIDSTFNMLYLLNARNYASFNIDNIVAE